MPAVKKRWSILVLEDNPDLRETIKSNFARLFDEAIHVDFAASICHAIDKLKKQMRLGLPYDVFWIDLYLDYFSYDNANGEIVSVDSFSQIVDTSAFCQALDLKNLTPHSLVDKLELDLSTSPENLLDCTTEEKLDLLKAFVPYCLPEAKSCFETLLELASSHLGFSDISDASRNEENSYSMHALDSVFRHLVNWVIKPKKSFTLSDEAPSALTKLREVPILPSREDKSDHSWTIFRAWVRRFYFSVGIKAKGYEEYANANPLLIELKRLTPDGYPQLLINTAYEGRRGEFLNTASIWESDDFIVTDNAFKGERKDDDLIKYVFRLCARLRRSYLALRRRRRGTSAFVIEEKILNPEYILTLKGADSYPVVIRDSEFGLAFTGQTFYPDFCLSLDQRYEVSEEFVEGLKTKSLDDLKSYLRVREPGPIDSYRLEIPSTFFASESTRERFYLKARAESGKKFEVPLTFDEGRWLFFELACRRWFPKCFLIHSRWTPFENSDTKKNYFLPMNELLLQAVKHAAVDQPALFPPAFELEGLNTVLQQTPSFYDPDRTYLSAFDWENLGGEVFKKHRLASNQIPQLFEALQLLYLAKHLVSILKIRRLADRLFDPKSFTPAVLCKTLEGCIFTPAQESIDQNLQRLKKAADMPNLIAEDHLPRIRNFLAITLCFYTLPSEPLVEFYHYWIAKQIPTGGTRPIEKFSTINKKLDGLSLIKSLSLPAQSAGKSRFLFIPSAINTHHYKIFIRNSNSTQQYSEPQDDIELTRMSCREFLTIISSQSL